MIQEYNTDNPKTHGNISITVGSASQCGKKEDETKGVESEGNSRMMKLGPNVQHLTLLNN